ncbi:MAG: response regulator [Desulfobacula sp.]|jgi:two-component system response regulator BaeR
MNRPEILIVEDDIKIAAILSDYFKSHDFIVSVLYRGDHVLAFLNGQQPDLILLDLMLPGMDGITLCREIRKFSMVPIIMLTARVEETDILLGLDLGADDYILKPFSPRQVVARAKAVLRRSRDDYAAGTVRTGPFSLNLQNREFRIHQTLIKITPNEFGILKTLMADPGRVFSRMELVARVQGYECEGYHRTIDTHIKNLRKKIAGHLPGKDVIHSIYGTGYRFSLDNNNGCPDTAGS